MSRITHAEALRRLYPRVLAKTLGLTRNLPDAEDAVQDAVERAIIHWSEHGAPESPIQRPNHRTDVHNLSQIR